MKSFTDFDEVPSKGVTRCPFKGCECRIIPLSPDLVSSIVELENAPKMTVDSKRFFTVNDAWDFDNIGVSKVSGDLDNGQIGSLAKVERLLVCGECDQGPLGFAGYTDAGETDVKKLRFYLSCESVKYDTPDISEIK